jgi:hypothetical protein
MGGNPVTGMLGRRLRLGVVGGGTASFIGGMHRMAARMDDRYEIVAGVLSSNPEKSLELLLTLGGHQTPSTAELRAAFAREYKAATLAADPDSRAWRQLWGAADAYVLRALNHGVGVADVQRLLRELPGYTEPHAGDAKQIGQRTTATPARQNAALFPFGSSTVTWQS